MSLRALSLRLSLTLAALLTTLPHDSAAAQLPADSGAFVVRIGHDTIKVERYVLRNGWLISESVRRGTSVQIQRFEARLNSDGSIASAHAHVFPWPATATATPVTGSSIYYRGDSTFLELGLPPATRRATYPGRAHVINIAVDPFVFALYAGIGAYAPRATGDSVRSQHFASTLGARPLTIRRESPELVTARSSIMGMVRIYVGDDGRVRGFDGTGSSLNYNGERIAWADLDSVARAFEEMNRRRGGIAVLSPRDSVETRIGDAVVRVSYGRPSMRGRTIFGGIVPWDRVWRAGANLATHLTTTRPLAFGRTVLQPGMYSLFVLPSAAGWTLIINGETNQWGTEYDAARDVARVPLAVRALDSPVEQFTIRIEPTRRGGVLRLQWERTEATATFAARR